MAKKKASNGDGSIKRGANNVAWVQCSLPRQPGEKLRRKRVPIPGSEKMTDTQARREGAKIARDVRDGKIVFDETPGSGGSMSAPTTVRQVGEGYTSGKMLKEHGAVNGLRPLSGGYIMGKTLEKHVYRIKTRGPDGPDFGELPVRDAKHTDVAKIMAAVKGSSSTRNHVHNYLSRIMSLAEIPLGLRPVNSNPVMKAYRAEPDEDKHFNFLYPPEVLALLGNKEIRIERRVLYLLATYFGWRKGSLFAFRWSGIDWTDGTVSVLKQKGHKRLDADQDDEGDAGDRDAQGVPIYFKAPGDVLAVLRAWHDHCGKPSADSLVVRDVFGEDEVWRQGHDERKALQADLKASGVTRSILYSTARNVEAIRFHDGRATFCTWARRAGKDDNWIRARTGHSPTSKMLDRYTRMAVTLADLEYDPFPDVLGAIPELAEAAKKTAALHTRLHTQAPEGATAEAPEVPQVPVSTGCEGGDLNPYASYGASTSS